MLNTLSPVTNISNFGKYMLGLCFSLSFKITKYVILSYILLPNGSIPGLLIAYTLIS